MTRSLTVTFRRYRSLRQKEKLKSVLRRPDQKMNATWVKLEDWWCQVCPGSCLTGRAKFAGWELWLHFLESLRPQLTISSHSHTVQVEGIHKHLRPASYNKSSSWHAYLGTANVRIREKSGWKVWGETQGHSCLAKMDEGIDWSPVSSAVTSARFLSVGGTGCALALEFHSQTRLELSLIGGD